MRSPRVWILVERGDRLAERDCFIRLRSWRRSRGEIMRLSGLRHRWRAEFAIAARLRSYVGLNLIDKFDSC